MSEWILSIERLPEDKKTVIAFNGEHIAPAFYHAEQDYWMAWTGWRNLDLYPFYPSHWMPFPDYPTIDHIRDAAKKVMEQHKGAIERLSDK
jgi:Protein of unknown function (DUF551)